MDVRPFEVLVWLAGGMCRRIRASRGVTRGTINPKTSSSFLRDIPWCHSWRVALVRTSKGAGEQTDGKRVPASGVLKNHCGVRLIAKNGYRVTQWGVIPVVANAFSRKVHGPVI